MFVFCLSLISLSSLVRQSCLWTVCLSLISLSSLVRLSSLWTVSLSRVSLSSLVNLSYLCTVCLSPWPPHRLVPACPISFVCVVSLSYFLRSCLPLTYLFSCQSLVFMTVTYLSVFLSISCFYDCHLPVCLPVNLLFL